jgi:hypothetical protein
MTRVITVREREEFLQAIVNKYMLPTLNTKGRDYTAYNAETKKKSANSNFSGLSEMMGDTHIDKFRVWSIFFLKHIQSILTWVATREVKSEKIEGRLTDALNYLVIFWSMLVEEGVIEDPRGDGIR